MEAAKRKMDEANTLEARLRRRLQQTTSASEIKAIQAKLAELTGTFDESWARNAAPSRGRAGEAAGEAALETAPEPAGAPHESIAGLEREDRDVEAAALASPGASRGSRASRRGDPSVPSSVPASADTSRDLPSSVTWGQLTQEKLRAQARYEELDAEKRRRMDEEYREAQKRDIEARAVQRRRQQAEDAQGGAIYGRGTAFDNLGRASLEFDRRQAEQRERLAVEQRQEYEEAQRRKAEEKRRQATEMAIDYDKLSIPTDRIDPATGKPKQSAIPDKYLQKIGSGAGPCPGKPGVLARHEAQRDEDLETMRIAAKQSAVERQREEQERARHFRSPDQIAERARLLQERADRDNEERRRRRFGGMEIPTDQEVTYGADHTSHFRTMREVELAREAAKAGKDVAIAPDSSLGRIFDADAKRSAKAGVAPLSEQERRAKAREEYYRRHPERRALTEDEQRVLEEHEAAVREAAEERAVALEKERAYKQELDRFAAQEKARRNMAPDEEALSRAEYAMNRGERYIKPLV